MEKNWITNWDQLATTPERELVLKIANAGLDAINTDSVMREYIKLDGDKLSVKGQDFELSKFKRVLVIGFGKASGKAALTLDSILGEKITDGVVISLTNPECKHIRTLVGTHPLPSLQNIEAAKEMANLIKDISEEDLVICLISGGGSALLCWDGKEMEQNTKLYNEYLKTGDDIKSLNTVRKHISNVKGGGLAAKLYPATVIGLIFSDIAGDNDHLVDSGPTFLDTSTVFDAKTIIDKYNLGEFELNETPKDASLFEKVNNITLVSNRTALAAMKTCAETLGKKSVIVSAEIFDMSEQTMKQMLEAAEPGTVILGGSEIKLIVTQGGGKGGRNTYLSTYSLNCLTEADTFAAVASDGLDNSDCAGAIVDNNTILKVKEQNLDTKDALERYDGYSLFEKTGHELIFTGPTEANVSDYLILYRK